MRLRRSTFGIDSSEKNKNIKMNSVEGGNRWKEHVNSYFMLLLCVTKSSQVPLVRLEANFRCVGVLVFQSVQKAALELE